MPIKKVFNKLNVLLSKLMQIFIQSFSILEMENSIHRYILNIEWLYVLYKYSEHPSKPSSSSSHFSAGVSWSDSVDANRQAPDSTKNFTIAKLLQLAAQCNGVQPSESWAFTSHPNSTKNLLKLRYYYLFRLP